MGARTDEQARVVAGARHRMSVRADLVPMLVFLAVPVIFLAPSLFGGKVLLPADDLFGQQPWRAFAGQFGVAAPHNHLIADMIFQNLSWKSFAQESLLRGEVPLWNPYLLAGVPFLAAGQYAVLYPLGLLFYLLPVPVAYAWFTALHLFLGAVFMYLFLRVIAVPRLGALVGGLAFAFSGFLVVSFVWPMVVSTAIWLPLLLALVELTVRGLVDRPSSTPSRINPYLWPLLGAIVVAMQFLAGHMEISFYVLFSAGFYAVARLAVSFWANPNARAFMAGLVMLLMVGLGTGIAAIQIVPFGEAISANFRAGFVGYDQVAGYALPKERLISFLIPDFFGNPAVHDYLDPLDGQVKLASHADSHGNTVDFFADWDRKNYVEGASYVGVLPLVFAGVALLFRRNRYTWTFAIFGTWSLLLAFGAPLYRLFFYGVPGFDQLHTPFRWLFPYTLSVTALAGIGAGWLAQARAGSHLLRHMSNALVLLATLGLAILAATLAAQSRFVPWLQGLVNRSDRLQDSFGDGRTFFAFEWRNTAVFFGFLFACGVILVLAVRRPAETQGVTSGSPAVPRRTTFLWPGLVVAVLVADLLVFGANFNTHTDPALVDFVPPAVQFLQRDPDLFRIISFGEEDVLTPNTAMRFHLQDARGYDTIIPRQYVDYWSEMEDPRGYLIYSKIHKLRDPRSLRSPLLDLLNVKYILSPEPLEVPGLSLVYRGELNIYRNERVLPRAFIVDDARGVYIAANRGEVASALSRPDFDPQRQLILEDADTPKVLASSMAGRSTASVDSYLPGEVVVSALMDAEGYLVLGDSYFPGWEARVDGTAAKIYRADGNFRAVYLSAGAHRVEFRYRPSTFLAGATLSAASLSLLLLAFVFLLWPRGLFAGYASAAQRAARNSLMPMSISLLNKVIAAGFAMLVLRFLGPTDVGKYTIAIVVYSYFEIFTSFGLNTLLTREVARDRAAGSRYLSNTTILRLCLWLFSLPLIAAFILAWRSLVGLETDSVLAILLLAASLVPGNIAGALSSLFYAYERMEYPALVTIVGTLLTVGLGTIALLSGWGFVGLAAVSLAVNAITMAILFWLVVRLFFRPRLSVEPHLIRGMVSDGGPLMLNILLSTIFFRVDFMMLQPMKGNAAVGYYGTAYRFVDALNVIPSAFTLAIFPLMSRYAESAKESLHRAYVLALKALLIASLPVTVGTVFLAEPIVLFFGGPEYVPHAAVALQWLIWFLPFSFVNSVTQYVLIAVNQQRFITLSFVVAASFNIIANLLLIPRYSYVGAAFVTVISEIVLLAPFLFAVRRHVGPLPLLSIAARPALAASAMGFALWPLAGANPVLLVPLGASIYFVVLLALRTFDEQDKLILRKLLRRKLSGPANAPESSSFV